MNNDHFLGIDCGSVSLNLALVAEGLDEPIPMYMRTQGKPLETFVKAVGELRERCGPADIEIGGALVTGSGRELLAQSLGLPAINEITAHAAGAFQVNPDIRTIIEIGGQDSKFIRMEPSGQGGRPRIVSFRMNEICAAGTGAFLDEQAGRLGIPVESFESIAAQSDTPAPIAGRCAVFAKTDMIHQAQEGTSLPDILLGAAFALARNYIGTLIRGDSLVPLVSLQGGVMANSAVVRAFRALLGLSEDEVTIPPHFKVLGALGSALIAKRSHQGKMISLEQLRERALTARPAVLRSAFSSPLVISSNAHILPAPVQRGEPDHEPPFVMGLDVGSVSAKGVVIDSHGRIVTEDYRLSKGRSLEALEQVIDALLDNRPDVNAFAVTGSGRSLAGRLLDADLIVNEISAQARAAVEHDPDVETIIEIGGQDSKWIALEDGTLKDFEMNRVCAAGTGSFLMEQADRIGLPMGKPFSDRAFSSTSPSDLGTRCTVFMESDLVHHQNNGASRSDLAAGVCISIVRNYLERVANHRPLGNKVMFLGGVAANAAVRAAFERQTGLSFESPSFFRVSGALGAALKALDSIRGGDMVLKEWDRTGLNLVDIQKETFGCKGCPNQCRIDKYRPGNRIVFHGGRCDRWEAEDRMKSRDEESDPFGIRTELLEVIAAVRSTVEPAPTEVPDRWGIMRSPQFYDWFPFWKTFCHGLGIDLEPAPRASREQFERGARYLRVETCLPMKVMAGQARDLVASGVDTIFHPAVLSEKHPTPAGRPMEHCPYIQASSQFFKAAFDVEWHEPVISFQSDPDAWRNEHLSFAESIGIRGPRAEEALEQGLAAQARFDETIERGAREFLDSIADSDRALVVLGKPYHTSDPFMNMNLASMFKRLGIKAMPGDIFPLDSLPTRSPIAWKHQLRMIAVARAVAADQRLFPVMITFFGCGPDPFTMRHIRESLKGKPLLVLEMDEHSSRAGLMTRLEAFLDHVTRYERRIGRAKDEEPVVHRPSSRMNRQGRAVKPRSRGRRVDSIYVPHFGDHGNAFAGAARSLDIDARALPPSDEESARLGRPHLMGGECHPYALILGDYLKLARRLPPEEAKRSLFSIPGYSACRLGQYPVYVEKVRKECGYSMRAIADLSQALTAFGLSRKYRDQALLRTWEGLNAYDVLLAVYLRMRPLTTDPDRLEDAYSKARDTVFTSLCSGEVEKGLEEALNDFYSVPLDETVQGPAIAITGDYYTRIVSFANNEVYREIENLGGIVWSPPTFSDSLKLYYLQEIMGNSIASNTVEFAARTSLYGSMVLSELRIKGSGSVRKFLPGRLDPYGLRMKNIAARYMDPRFPPGITAPFATALDQLDQGADGVLNLITLNCSFGTVVTAALNKAMKERPHVPMLTLVFDGLKKTNEKTRVEAFMEQAHDHFRRQLT